MFLISEWELEFLPLADGEDLCHLSVLLTTAEPTVWHGAKYFTHIPPGIVRATIINPVFQMGQVEAQRSLLTCPRSHNS